MEGEIFSIYLRLCELKKKHMELSEGGMKIILCRERIFAFARIAGDDVIIIICSMDDAITEADIPIEQFGKKDLYIQTEESVGEEMALKHLKELGIDESEKRRK